MFLPTGYGGQPGRVLSTQFTPTQEANVAKLKVWGGTDYVRKVADKQVVRIIVAASSVAKAVDTLRVAGIYMTAGYLSTYWGRTFNEAELTVACEPGVWYAPGAGAHGAKHYVKLTGELPANVTATVTAPAVSTCLNCGLANWFRTKAGRLHPAGDGRCTWQLPVIPLPKSRRNGGFGRGQQAVLADTTSGNHIERQRPYADCPCWAPLKETT